MTDLGRGHGSQPWSPDDPLFGDLRDSAGAAQPGGYGGYGRAAQQYPGGYAGPQAAGPYGPPAPPQQGGPSYGPGGGQPLPGQPGPWPGQGAGTSYGTGAQPGYPGAGGPYPGGQAPQGGGWQGGGQGGHYGGEPYPGGRQPSGAQYPGAQPPGGPYPGGQYPGGGQPGEPYDDARYAGEHGGDQYGGDQYGGHQYTGDQHGGDQYDGDQYDGEEFGEDPHRPVDPDRGGFLREQEAGRGAERRRKDRDRKSGLRNSGACLLVAVVLLGIGGGGAYYGYSFWRDHFGPPPDYAGSGTGSVQVDIKDGATVTDMALALEQAGVIKSVKAFINANEAKKNRAASVQPGLYTMHHRMSAASALQLLLDSMGGDALIIPEGRRATQIYALIDRKLHLRKGATAAVAEKKINDLGLPAWAHGDIEGFLYPTRYSIGKDTKPEEVLKQMVHTANDEYAKLDLAAGARKVGLAGPHQLLTVASLVQAEGLNSDDFGKIARVVYNRLRPGNTETNGYLQFDSTFNYAKNTSTLHLSLNEMRSFRNPYNTYYVKGLPPGPISNPGEEALKSALNPTPGTWYYFVSVTPTDTRFATTRAEHEKNVAAFNAEQAKENKGTG